MYPAEVVSQLREQRRRHILAGREYCEYVLTVTSCKRLELFCRTINSFLNHCRDITLFDRFICIDDNSSAEDRAEMLKLYPFFDFYFKTKEEKGHAQSMNILLELMKHQKKPTHSVLPMSDEVFKTSGTVATHVKYVFHLEDDWEFIRRDFYLAKATNILGADYRIGQVLLNHNYAETLQDKDIAGGHKRMTGSGTVFIEHEYCPDDQTKNVFLQRWGHYQKQCNYWPHWSLRPGLNKACVFDEVGSFTATAAHFENEYAYRYTTQKKITVFFPDISCLHIGKLTSEKNGLNAYALNAEKQFGEQLRQLHPFRKVYVVNLDRRSDRYMKTQQRFANIFELTRFSAIDGEKLQMSYPLFRFIAGNDFKERKSMIGCALSHLLLWNEIAAAESADSSNSLSENQPCLILEDDISGSHRDLVQHLDQSCREAFAERAEREPCELLYLGHTGTEIEDSVGVSVQVNAVTDPFTTSLGGTFAYAITPKGARKLLKFIDQTGLTNGIDWVMMKATKAGVLKTSYFSVNLLNSEAWRGNAIVDSDIQFSNSSFAPLTIAQEFAHHQANELILVVMKEHEAIFVNPLRRDEGYLRVVFCAGSIVLNTNESHLYSIPEICAAVIWHSLDQAPICHKHLQVSALPSDLMTLIQY
jgi:GR25 family glycosyltransferase involved in LPS biosynthesis